MRALVRVLNVKGGASLRRTGSITLCRRGPFGNQAEYGTASADATDIGWNRKHIRSLPHTLDFVVVLGIDMPPAAADRVHKWRVAMRTPRRRVFVLQSGEDLTTASVVAPERVQRLVLCVPVSARVSEYGEHVISVTMNGHRFMEASLFVDPIDVLVSPSAERHP